MRGDINLLPKKRSGDITKIASGFILGIIILLAVVAVVFVYMPNIEKRRIKKDIEYTKSEIEKIAVTKEDYNKVLDELNILKEKNTIFKNIRSRNLAFSEILVDFESATPTSIVFDELNYSSGFLNIKGTTPSPLELSQFMVNLRRLDNVILVSLSTVEYVEITGEDTNPGFYTFELSIVFYEVPEEGAEEDVEEDIDSQEETIDESNPEETITEEGAQ